jgi:hypothetical protein
MNTRRILVAGIVILMSLVFPGNANAQCLFKPGSEPDGFRGIKWGTHISKLKGFRKISKKRIKEEYINTMTNSSIGSVLAKEIIYQFINGKFANVILYFNLRNYDDIRNELTKQFGMCKPLQNMEIVKMILYNGDKTQMHLRESFDKIVLTIMANENELLKHWSKG